jgi:hypothetical protein
MSVFKFGASQKDKNDLDDAITQLRNFIKWMGDYGFEKFMTSSKNNNNPVTCIAADESMDWGHYFEIE